MATFLQLIFVDSLLPAAISPSERSMEICCHVPHLLEESYYTSCLAEINAKDKQYLTHIARSAVSHFKCDDVLVRELCNFP